MKPRITEQRYGELWAAAHDDPYVFADGLPDEWDQFRRDSISDLVGRIYREVKAVRPELLVSAAVLPEWRSAAQWHFQAWSTWLAEGILDVAVPMAYTRDSGEFHGWIDSALTAAGDRGQVWAGVGAYLNPVERTVEQIARARAVWGQRGGRVRLQQGRRSAHRRPGFSAAADRRRFPLTGGAPTT